MIAKVRIAPVERWPEDIKAKVMRYPDYPRLVGLEIGIYTESMFKNSAGSRSWKLEENSMKLMHELIGSTPFSRTDLTICEGMLEMD